MRILKTLIISLIIITSLTFASSANASAWEYVTFRMGAPASYWKDVAQCQAGNKNQVNWKQLGIQSGGLQIHTNSSFGQPDMGIWEQYGGEQFAPSPDKASVDQQIIIANRIAITGFKTKQINSFTIRPLRDVYVKHPLGFNHWSCIATSELDSYSKIEYTVRISTDPTFSCPKYENLFRKYGLPPKVFSYIAYRESRCNTNAVNARWKDGKLIWTLNNNKTYDSGLLQINSSWIGTLKREFGYSSSDLFKADVNARFASWILNNTSGRLRNWSLYAK